MANKEDKIAKRSCKEGEKGMLTWMMIVVLLVVITVVATVLIGRNGDANYSKATKGNIKRLTINLIF